MGIQRGYLKEKLQPKLQAVLDGESAVLCSKVDRDPLQIV
jgi:hypothetical protein